MSDGPLARLARRAVTQPIADPVANDDAALLARKGVARMAYRVAKRELEVALSGQAAREVARIDPAWRRAIWFHAEAPQLGDALLDLAPRSLLVERGLALDIVLPKTLSGVFRGDRWFRAVHEEGEPVDVAAYEVAIVDSRCWKSLAGKRRAAPALPWVSVRGDYLAYDYQRGQLAARRFAELLGVSLDEAAERRHARQKLEIVGEPALDPGAEGRVAIAMGGVQSTRTYCSWPEVAHRLAAGGVRRFALLGSSNGRTSADAVLDALKPFGADVLDRVARTDIAGTQRAMAAAAMVVCVDGGLMHLACTTSVPMLALFDATIRPAWRVPLDFSWPTIVSTTADVNAIAPEAIAAAALRLRGRQASAR